MKFYLFSETYRREVKPTCCFGLYDKEVGAMVDCGKPAVGSLRKSSPLCDEHFKYAMAANGISDVKPQILYHETERNTSRKPVI